MGRPTPKPVGGAGARRPLALGAAALAALFAALALSRRGAGPGVPAASAGARVTVVPAVPHPPEPERRLATANWNITYKGLTASLSDMEGALNFEYDIGAGREFESQILPEGCGEGSVPAIEPAADPHNVDPVADSDYDRLIVRYRFGQGQLLSSPAWTSPPVNSTGAFNSTGASRVGTLEFCHRLVLKEVVPDGQPGAGTYEISEDVRDTTIVVDLTADFSFVQPLAPGTPTPPPAPPQYQEAIVIKGCVPMVQPILNSSEQKDDFSNWTRVALERHVGDVLNHSQADINITVNEWRNSTPPPYCFRNSSGQVNGSDVWSHVVGNLNRRLQGASQTGTPIADTPYIQAALGAASCGAAGVRLTEIECEAAVPAIGKTLSTTSNVGHFPRGCSCNNDNCWYNPDESTGFQNDIYLVCKPASLVQTDPGAASCLSYDPLTLTECQAAAQTYAPTGSFSVVHLADVPQGCACDGSQCRYNQNHESTGTEPNTYLVCKLADDGYIPDGVFFLVFQIIANNPLPLDTNIVIGETPFSSLIRAGMAYIKGLFPPFPAPQGEVFQNTLEELAGIDLFDDDVILGQLRLANKTFITPIIDPDCLLEDPPPKCFGPLPPVDVTRIEVDVADFLQAFQCDGAATFGRAEAPLAPGDELRVCIKVTNSFRLTSLDFMEIYQQGVGALDVIEEGDKIKYLSITSREYNEDENGVYVATRVPSNLFAFAQGNNITVSGRVVTALQRRLQAAADRALQADDEEGVFRLRLTLYEEVEAEGTPVEPTVLGKSAATSSQGIIVMGFIFTVVFALFL